MLYLKGALFLFSGLLASGLILMECPSVKVGLPMCVSVRCSARAYYFAFYVVEHYADPGYRFAGLWSFARYALARRASKGERLD